MSEEITAVAGLKISDEEFGNGSISSLADRPNASSTLGGGGLDAASLKARFDKNPKLIKERLNELLDKIENGEVAENLKARADGLTLKGIYDAITDGTLAATYLKAKKNANAAEQTLNEILAAIDSDLSEKGEALATKADAETVNSNLAKKLDANGASWEEDVLELPSWIRIKNGFLDGEEEEFAEFAGDSVQIGEDIIAFPFEGMREALDGTGNADLVKMLATEQWVTEQISRAQIASVNDFVQDGVRMLEITFNNPEIPPITMKFDDIFNNIDSLLADKASKADLAQKLDKTTDKNAIYANDGNGNPVTLPYGYTPAPYTVAMRDGSGVLQTETPTEGTHCANKDYVDAVGKRVDKLEGMLIKETINDSVAYEKPVPEASSQKAILSSVGGISKIVDIEVINQEYEVPIEALVNIGILEAGTYVITVKGDDNLSALGSIHYGDDGYYWNCDFDGGETKIELTSAHSVTIAFYAIAEGVSSATCSVLVKKLELQSAPVTEIVSEGKNLIPFPYAEGTKTAGGGRFRVDANKSLVVSGTITSQANFYFVDNDRMILPAGSYTVYIDGDIKSTGKITLWLFNAATSTVIQYISFKEGKQKETFTLKEKTNFSVYFVFIAGEISGSANVRIVSNDSGKTYPMPEAILALPDYGVGLDKERTNKADFDAEIYEHKYGVVDMGALSWSLRIVGTNKFMAKVPQIKEQSNADGMPFLLTAKYNSTTFNATWMDGDIAQYLTDIFVYDTSVGEDASMLKEKLAGQILVYELAEPEYIDISNDIATLLNGKDYFFIEVEGGGTVRFENENKLDVPSEITFAEV